MRAAQPASPRGGRPCCALDGHRRRAVEARPPRAAVAHRPAPRRRAPTSRAVRAAIAALLPPDAQVVTAADDRERTGDLSRAYRVNLDMLALMALFTGAFLVYSTQSLAVARRRAQLALLRVIGVTRGRVVAQVLAEGTLQGAVGGALGLVAGIAFAAAALRFFGGDLGGGYFASTGFDLHRLVFAAPDAALLFFGLGLAAALVGSFFPARAAARAAPGARAEVGGRRRRPRARVAVARARR